MSQQHPTFPPHLPRGAVAASAITLPKNVATTVLRAGTSPAIQIPAAPSVPSVSVSVRTPVNSAIRPGTPPTTRSPSPAVSMADHRTNLIVQGTAGSVPMTSQPLQITLTQRLSSGAATVGMSEAMKLTPLCSKTVQVAAGSGLVQHQKVVTATQPAVNTLAGLGITPHLPQAVSKPGGLQVSAGVPAISISSLSAPLSTATVVAPVSTSIPIAKVTPQRQQMPLTTGLPTAVAVQALTSGSEFTTIPDLNAMATQAGASHLLLSQTQRSQTGTIVATTAGASSIPTVATSLPAAHGERALPQAQAMFNLTAAPASAPGQGQDMWLSHFFYQPARTPFVSAPTNSTPIVRPAANTFFLPRPATDQSKISNQAPNLAASLSHPLTAAQPAMLFNTHMVVDGTLRQPLPLNVGTAPLTGAISSSATTVVTGVSSHSDSKPVISLSSGSSGGQPGLHTSLITVSTAAITSQSADPSAFLSSTSLHMAASLASGSSAASVLPANLSLSAVNNLTSRATVASSIIAAHPTQTAGSLQPQPPGTPGGGNSSPRPSILRKRAVDGNTVMPRKPNFNLMTESHSPRPDPAPLSNISSPKTPATENSQSSTDTALSSNDATTPTHNSHGDIRVKTESLEGAENGPSAASPAVSLAGSITDASPRKRARKQLFDVSHRNVNEEVKDNSSSDDDLHSKLMVKDTNNELPPDMQDEYIDDEGVRWTRERTKPTMSIMGDYTINWKPRYNHFQRHSDVRPKDDRNPTVNELISQRGILQKASGWKLYYVSSQVEDVMDNEQNMEERMEKLKERLATKAATHSSCEHDYNKLLELTRGNLQRCQVVRQQMLEAKNNMLNILKHQPKIKEIIHKNLAKRTIKKKERS